MKARRRALCPLCDQPIEIGQDIARLDIPAEFENRGRTKTFKYYWAHAAEARERNEDNQRRIAELED